MAAGGESLAGFKAGRFAARWPWIDSTRVPIEAAEAQSLVLGAASAKAAGEAETKLVPPLEWIDGRDSSQMELVFAVLKNSPFLMEYYLNDVVFPAVLRHADAKLSANGQDLGGEVLCSSRLGFSGTPNDLLPLALGKCQYARGDDAKMLNTLSDPLVVDVALVDDGWSAQTLLSLVATHDPPFNALIDVGALITGLSNEQVAHALLDFGLPYEAVVFLDPGGEPWLLRRGRSVAVKMSNCSLPLSRRFVFYDQVHTTGIDIRHPPMACAALTLGKAEASGEAPKSAASGLSYRGYIPGKHPSNVFGSTFADSNATAMEVQNRPAYVITRWADDN
ncbi:hypothetical protein AK812_SmicGene32454 [Symbiodinium microadriaticum]|uniref:ubiquitinyl hydrolase 1 n=1 Tax=Symbiodinium microadriaticum TaxID=2951 RepID=A0A1Q9CU46_SYMMI|nr:hypothetical protein AK812_SmicGene32454 [Symbiodinium microadriaticum]